MNFYNEIDPFAAAWLRNLITASHLPAGVVDERSIEDIAPHELTPYTQCHFFAGIGGWPLALRMAGWPDDRPVWTGSCPCQPFSSAGKGEGFDDERHVWPAWQWLIEQCHPAIILGEQVASPAARLWLDLVFADLEGAGYACGAANLCAAGAGAPHIRQRLYWVAHASGNGHAAAKDWGGTGAGEDHRRVQQLAGICDACRRFFERYRCNSPDECDCPRCQGYCDCRLADADGAESHERVMRLHAQGRNVDGIARVGERSERSGRLLPTPCVVEPTTHPYKVWERKQRLTEKTGVYRGNDCGLGSKVQLVAGWPTPVRNDSSNTANSTATRHNPDSKHHAGTTLVDAVRGTISSGSPAATEKPGQLNPEFSRWLMGYPAAWESCAPTAMPSSRRSQRNSSKVAVDNPISPATVSSPIHKGPQVNEATFSFHVASTDAALALLDQVRKLGTMVSFSCFERTNGVTIHQIDEAPPAPVQVLGKSAKASRAPTSPTATAAVEEKTADASSPSAAPAATQPPVSTIEYPVLQKAVAELYGRDKLAPVTIAKALGFDSFKTMPAERWAEALVAVKAKLADTVA